MYFLDDDKICRMTSASIYDRMTADPTALKKTDAWDKATCTCDCTCVKIQGHTAVEVTDLESFYDEASMNIYILDEQLEFGDAVYKSGSCDYAAPLVSKIGSRKNLLVLMRTANTDLSLVNGFMSVGCNGVLLKSASVAEVYTQMIELIYTSIM